MPVIWCWVAVLTMSNSLVVSTENNLRQLVIRPAKVWQAMYEAAMAEKWAAAAPELRMAA